MADHLSLKSKGTRSSKILKKVPVDLIIMHNIVIIIICLLLIIVVGGIIIIFFGNT